MMKTGSAPLAVLSHIQDPSETRIGGLPSWVPDFSAKLGRTPFDEDRFRAGYPGDDEFSDPPLLLFRPDGTLSLEGVHVEDVSSTTNLEGDLLVQILTLALHSPAKHLKKSMSWWCEDGRRELRCGTVSRVEALWRTLLSDDVTNMKKHYGSLDSRDGLGNGFANWILMDILEALEMYLMFVSDYPDDPVFPKDLIHELLCTKMALWSAMYDGLQLGEGEKLDLRDFGDAMEDLGRKRDKELEESESKKTGDHFVSDMEKESCIEEYADPILTAGDASDGEGEGKSDVGIEDETDGDDGYGPGEKKLEPKADRDNGLALLDGFVSELLEDLGLERGNSYVSGSDECGSREKGLEHESDKGSGFILEDDPRFELLEDIGTERGNNYVSWSGYETDSGLEFTLGDEEEGEGESKETEEENNNEEWQDEEDNHKTPPKFLPTARSLSDAIAILLGNFDDEHDDRIGGFYHQRSLHRLSPLERRQYRNFESRMRKAIEGRKFFLTKSGRFVLGPPSIGQDPGRVDEVWALDGARVPFILHKDDGGKYTVVGESCVHGLMYGEFAPEPYYSEQEEGFTEMIRLC